MGIFGSSEETIESKAIDTNGQVNNNIIIQEARDTHAQMLLNEKLLFASYLLVASEALKLVIYVCHTVKKVLKKKYQGK